jgi:hypothetical protein
VFAQTVHVLHQVNIHLGDHYCPYAEIGIFVLMYLVCSQCRMSIDLPVWPTYELLRVLHFNLYMPLEFILFGGIAYALHILSNKHEYGSADRTTKLLKPCN